MPKPVPRNPSVPQTGIFKIRLVRGGPWAAASIVKDRTGLWYATIDGMLASHGFSNPTECREIMRIWQFGRDVTEAEYRTLTRQDRTVPINEKINLVTKESIF